MVPSEVINERSLLADGTYNKHSAKYFVKLAKNIRLVLRKNETLTFRNDEEAAAAVGVKNCGAMEKILFNNEKVKKIIFLSSLIFLISLISLIRAI